jgi:hypothetical protein
MAPMWRVFLTIELYELTEGGEPSASLSILGASAANSLSGNLLGAFARRKACLVAHNADG